MLQVILDVSLLRINESDSGLTAVFLIPHPGVLKYSGKVNFIQSVLQSYDLAMKIAAFFDSPTKLTDFEMKFRLNLFNADTEIKSLINQNRIDLDNYRDKTVESDIKDNESKNRSSSFILKHFLLFRERFMFHKMSRTSIFITICKMHQASHICNSHQSRFRLIISCRKVHNANSVDALTGRVAHYLKLVDDNLINPSQNIIQDVNSATTRIFTSGKIDKSKGKKVVGCIVCGFTGCKEMPTTKGGMTVSIPNYIVRKCKRNKRWDFIS